MKNRYALSAATAIVLLIGSSSLAAEKPEIDEKAAEELKVETVVLAGDSLAVDIDAKKKKEIKKVEDKSVDTIADAFTKGTVRGLLRYSGQHRDSSLYASDQDSMETPYDVKAYSAIGGYLGYETAPYFYTSIGATFYTSNPLGNNPADREGLGGLKETTEGQKSYNVLGEAFLHIENEGNNIKIGRQEMPGYRFVSLSNIRMTPYTHEGAIYENRLIDGLQLNVAYITKQKGRNAENFEGMVRSARVKTGCGEIGASGECIDGGKPNNIRGDYNPLDYDVDGNYIGDAKEMGMIGAVYKRDGWQIEGWDYYVADFINTLYLYGQYNYILSEEWELSLAGQYAKQQDIGSHVAGSVDTWFYGVKAQASSGSGMLFFLNYNEVQYNEGSYDSGTLFVRWGTPQMFNSFQVQDSELAGTKSVGVGAQFDLGALGILDSTVIRFRYANYDMPDDLWMINARQDRSEATFDLRYSFSKTEGFGIFTQMDGLSIQLRLAYDDYSTDYDFEAYKRIHGYSFETVTDNFVDARLYIDYIF